MWVEINSMREKTVAVLFSRKQKPPERFLTFEGKTLEYADSVRYLGVELDKGLFWKLHVDEQRRLLWGLVA